MRRDRSLLDKPSVSERNVIRREFSISFKISFSSLSKINLSQAPNIPFHHGAIQELWVWVAALIPGNGPTYQIISCSTQSTPRPVPWWHSALQSGVVVVVLSNYHKGGQDTKIKVYTVVVSWIFWNRTKYTGSRCWDGVTLHYFFVHNFSSLCIYIDMC